MILILKRKIFTQVTTLGTLSTDKDILIGHTLEDAVRPEGVKVQGKTAIPKGKYELVLSMSNRFKRLMPEVLNVPMFTGIRIHGGNTHDDTEGCPILGARTDLRSRVWDCARVNVQLIRLLQDMQDKDEKVFLEVT